MKIAPYVSKLNDSSQFKDFQKEHKDAFIVAGFFVLDYEYGKNIHQIDYYVPSKKKIAAFTLDKRITMQMLDLMNSKTPEKLDLKTKIDLDQLQGILEDEMKNRSITAEIKKVIAIIQNLDGKKIWNLSCVISGMGILNAHVEDDTKTVLKMEKKSLLDFVQKMSPEQFKSKLGAGANAQTETETEDGSASSTPSVNAPAENPSAQIKKLEELEQAIEKEKTALMNQVKAKSVKKTSKPKKS